MNFIRNIFFPEKIGSYYIFSKRIVGLEIRKTEIIATKVLLYKNRSIIEQCDREAIKEDESLTYAEQAAESLKVLMRRLKPYHEVHLGLSSAVTIFKELTVPFADPEKISMMFRFEVEPLLPFSLEDAVADFIITSKKTEHSQTTILVAAIQKEQVMHRHHICNLAGIELHAITIDLIALYGLFKQIPAYTALKGGLALLTVDTQTTRIAYIHDGALRLVRTINYGISHITKLISEKLNISPNEAMDKFLRLGFTASGDDNYDKATQIAATDYWNTLELTFASCATLGAAITETIHVGNTTTIPGLAEQLSKISKIPTSQFDLSVLDGAQGASISVAHTKRSCHPMNICLALPTPTTEQFNLLPFELRTHDRTQTTRQIWSTAFLTIIMLGALLTSAFIEKKHLAAELAASEEETREQLYDRYTILRQTDGTLEDLADEAQQILKKEESTWFRFSKSHRASFLKYLLELTNLIDRQKTGFNLDSLSITNDIMIIKAQVRNHPALVTLTKDLKKSKLFGFVESPEDPEFTMSITLSNNGSD